MTGADNQQERLASAESANWFLAGFIEGEGALCVSIKAHPTCRSGFYVDPGFFLYQHESGRRLLELAQQTFGSGRIARKSGSETVLTYEISSGRSWTRWSEVSTASPKGWRGSSKRLMR